MPTVSASWKASLPIMWVGTCPVRQTTGTLSIKASVNPVTVLVARSRGDQDHAHPAGAAGIAFGRVHRALLVPDQDVTDRVLLEDRVVDWQYRRRDSRIPPRHPLDQRAEHDLRAVHRAGLSVRAGTAAVSDIANSFDASALLGVEDPFSVTCRIAT